MGRSKSTKIDENGRGKKQKPIINEDASDSSEDEVLINKVKSAQKGKPSSARRGRPSSSTQSSRGRLSSHNGKDNGSGDEFQASKASPKRTDKTAKSKKQSSDESSSDSDAPIQSRVKQPSKLANKPVAKSVRKDNTPSRPSRSSRASVTQRKLGNRSESNSDGERKDKTPSRPSRSSRASVTQRKPRKSESDRNSDSGSDEENAPIAEKIQSKKTASPTTKKGTNTVKKSNNNIGRSKKGQDKAEYEVEAIIDHRDDAGRKYYLIRWQGYGAEDDTWENERRIHCPALIAKYREEHPDDLPLPPKVRKSKKKKKQTNPPNESAPKKIKIDQQSDYEEPPTDDETQWEVAKILDVYFRKDQSREFLIRWKDYSSAADTWEPESNLDCKELIDNFMEKLDRRVNTTERELRVARTHTQHFTLMDHGGNRRLSKRNSSRQRVLYYDAE